MPAGIIYSATPTPLSASWREVWWGQWGRLLDSEVRRWRGVLWPFTQPLWRLLSPPFRMSWMCCTIKLMATAGKRKKERWLHRILQNSIRTDDLAWCKRGSYPLTEQLYKATREIIPSLPNINAMSAYCMIMVLTKVICSSGNNHICILLCLVEIKMSMLKLHFSHDQVGTNT